MKTIMTFLSTVLGAFALVIKLMVFFPAFVVLDFPLWLSLLAAFIISTVPVLGSILNIILWIWALIICLTSPLTTVSIIFYILFTIYALDLLQAVIRAFIE